MGRPAALALRAPFSIPVCLPQPTPPTAPFQSVITATAPLARIAEPTLPTLHTSFPYPYQQAFAFLAAAAAVPPACTLPP